MVNEIERVGMDQELVRFLIREHNEAVRPGLDRLWSYYRNALDFSGADDKRPYRMAQQVGLPHRLTHERAGARRTGDAGGNRREIVIENDIAWRVHTLVDFMFGKGLTIESMAGDAGLGELIERVLNAVIEANGGVCFFQDMALLGSVYGYSDVMLRVDDLFAGGASGGGGSGAVVSTTGGDGRSWVPSKEDTERALRAASRMVLETVEAPRAIPVLDPSDYRRLVGYVIHYRRDLNRVERGGVLSRLLEGRGRGQNGGGRRASEEVTEVWTADRVEVWRDGEMVSSGVNVLGMLPVVHIQNLPQPFFYEGLSEVEPLVPLQDELNTRLSDRGNRVTMQSFKMYLGKGIEGFTDRVVGPGQMWMSDNPEASIQSFGGDGDAPSEEMHIQEIREAMDKASGVTGAAAGLLRSKVGSLTSENALRVVLMGLLAKTEKKRVTYGKGIERVCEMVLTALDTAGILRTEPADRRVKLHWPSPLPVDESQRLKEALMKLEIGVPRERVLSELGYRTPELKPTPE